MSKQQLTLELPYATIEKVANRQYIREKFSRTSEDCHYIPLNKIEEREGFNCRTVYDGIDELADDMFYNDQKEAMVLDVLQDGKAKINEGYRRFRALKRNVELGRIKGNHLVKFRYNNSKVTEFDRMAGQITSNGNFKKEFKPYEKAKVIWNLKYLFSVKPLTSEEIAKSLKYQISRQHVDNFLRIAEADDRQRQEMITADMNMKECLELVNSKNKLDKQTAKAELDANKNEAGKTPAPFDPNAKELAELNDLTKQEVDENTEDWQPEEPLSPIVETPEAKEIREAKEQEEFAKIADEVSVKKLNLHLDKKLAKAVRQIETDDLVNTDNGEIKEKQEFVSLFLNKGTVITADIIKQLQDKKVKTVFLYKLGCEPVAPSVITEPVATKEKEKYDSSRPEIKAVQKAIKCMDKIEAIVSKLDVPDDVKKDIAYNVHWGVTNLQEAREWIHLNKKQNKMR